MTLAGELKSVTPTSFIGGHSLVVSPMSTIAEEKYGSASPSITVATAESIVATSFGLGAHKSTSFDHINALSLEDNSVALDVMATTAKLNAVINLGSGYIAKKGQANGVTEASARQYMYTALTSYLGVDQAFDFTTTTDTIQVLKNALASFGAEILPATSRRALLQVSEDDLNALADVMLVVFETVEKKKSEGTDVATAVEELTKTTIAAETEVVKDVEALGAGTLTPEAFKDANTAEKVESKVAAAEVPATFQDSLEEALTPDTAVVLPPAPPSGGDDSTTLIIIIVVAVVVVAGGGGVYAFWYRRKRKGQQVAVMPALDATKLPDLEEGSRGGLLPPLDSPGGGSSGGKVSVMPFVASPPLSPTPAMQKKGQ
ncbi:hypothetical protein A3770_17p79690 [Chloropicon primus]|uniref:Uncharacterized protein n=1 Tax=Chloropicon primus TaxID=1764295 RepID=A0A5B8MYL7_9CHLO|nr:hypothetical protein A3770_17p79690 [Chloropicon primus]|eukprot:QDZ25451.1 hypothetical protein A3770_17p79690 [Chloropicon primus]